jgi:hypothetical protein
MTSTQLILSCALASLAVLLALAGCGGGEETAEASMSIKQFRVKANLICNEAGTEQFEKVSLYLGQHPKAKEADAIKPAGIPPLEKELGELKALPSPRGHEGEIEAFFEAFEEGLEQGKTTPPSLLSEKHNPFEEANQLGKKYQLGDCALSP